MSYPDVVGYVDDGFTIVGARESADELIGETYDPPPGGSQGPAGPTGPQGPTGPTGPQGIQGPAGPQGIQGIQGVQGTQGNPGTGINVKGNVSTFTSLPGSPTIGDAWFTDDSDVLWTWTGSTWRGSGSLQGPQGAQGVQGIQGPTGPTGPQGIQGPAGPTGSTGADGRSVLNGSGAPSSGTGVNGDFYLNTSANTIYGPKTGGVWGSPVSLVGPTGPQGPQGTQGIQGPTGSTGPTGASGADGKTVLNGSGAPSSGLGSNGDFYIDTAANLIYGPKTSGAWGSGTSLVGPTGPAGTTTGEGLTLSDSTTNNSSTSNHGFLKKLSGTSTDFMNGSGAWATPNLLKLPESSNTSAPNATVPVLALTATDGATNADIAIIPKGTGSIMCQIPDSGNTNGNKRGTGSVDLQLNGRTAAAQVVSGNNSIGAGKRNVVSGNTSAAFGDSNTSSGLGSMAFGVSNTSSSTQSTAIGSNNNALAAYTFITGFQASSFAQIGKHAQSSGAFTTVGDAQVGRSVLRIPTTDATATVMSTDANAAAANNQIVLQNNSTFQFRGMITAKQTGTTNVAAWEVTGLVVRGANAASTTLVVSTVTAISNTPGWGTPALAADTTLGALKITVTGLVATNIHWVSFIETTEVIY